MSSRCCLFSSLSCLIQRTQAMEQQRRRETGGRYLAVPGATGHVQRRKVVRLPQLCVETDTATTSWRLISEAQTPETPTAPTEYLAIPCELKADTGLGDPDRLAVAGRSGDAPKRKRGEACNCRSRLTRWRSSTTADDGVRKRLAARSWRRNYAFPTFPLPSSVCPLHSALTPLRRRLAALTPPLVQKKRVGES